MKDLQVKIESMDDEGRGRGHYDTQSGVTFDVAVRGALPNDLVIARVERVFSSRNLIVARVIQHVERSELHVRRECEHDSPCPACPLHAVQTSLALAIKRGRIEQALMDNGLDFEVDDVICHPHEFGYRQKVKLMAQVVQNRLRLGVFVPYSHDFVPAEKCPYVNPKINKAIEEMLQALHRSNCSMADLKSIKAVIVRAGAEGVSAIFVTKTPLSSEIFHALSHCVRTNILVGFKERIQSEDTNSILGGRPGRAVGADVIESLEGGPKVDPDSFCQSDPLQATKMYDLVAQFLVGSDGFHEGFYVDAYAGVGGFTRALLRCGARRIIAIEQAPNALSALEELGVDVILSPMVDALKNLEFIDVIGMVVDPPKKGLMQDAKRIAALNVKRVALVSCDPDAMARDLSVFVAASYKVEHIIPMDFFGGTPAIETIVLMKK